jgi:hypothetical protein
MPHGLAGRSLAALVAALAFHGPAAAEEDRAAKKDRSPCRFFESRAVGDPPGSMEAEMAMMCRALAEYRRAIIAAEFARAASPVLRRPGREHLLTTNETTRRLMAWRSGWFTARARIAGEPEPSEEVAGWESHDRRSAFRP